MVTAEYTAQNLVSFSGILRWNSVPSRCSSASPPKPVKVATTIQKTTGWMVTTPSNRGWATTARTMNGIETRVAAAPTVANRPRNRSHDAGNLTFGRSDSTRVVIAQMTVVTAATPNRPETHWLASGAAALSAPRTWKGMFTPNVATIPDSTPRLTHGCCD